MARRRYTPPPVMTPVASAPVTQISTPGLMELYRQAQNRAKTFDNLFKSIRRLEKEIERAERRATRWTNLGWLGSWARSKAEKWEEEAHRLDVKRVDMEQQAESARLSTVFNVGDLETPTWQRLVSAFEAMCNTERVWDETAWGASEHPKSSASRSVDRQRVHLGIRPLPTIRPDVPALHFANANGPDLWIYPLFIAVGDAQDYPALVDLREVRVEFSYAQFIESESVPQDAEQVGYTWRFVNKDGSPDRRFSHNPRYPVMLYGQIDITSSGGLRERFLVSDKTKASAFATRFKEHRAAILQDT